VETIYLDPDTIGKRGMLYPVAIAVGGAGGQANKGNGYKTRCKKPFCHGATFGLKRRETVFIVCG
jgi:hypothetical protein